MKKETTTLSATVSKNKTGQIGHRVYMYVDIAQIHEYLESINASYYQFIDRIDGDDYIMTVRIINGEEREPLRGCRVVNASLIGSSNPAQEQGSALTYARRYSLLMAFGLATEDDDAQCMSKPKENNETRKASPKQIAVLEKAYQGDNLKKLLEINSLEKLEDMPLEKASELSGTLKGGAK